MGRGRQKAKQRKVARKLKYFSADTDYAALQRELAAQRGETIDTDDQGSYEDDPYAKYADKYADMYADDDADDWEDWASAHR